MNTHIVLTPEQSILYIEPKVIAFYGSRDSSIRNYIEYLDPNNCVQTIVTTSSGAERILRVNSCIVCPHGEFMKTIDDCDRAGDGYGIKCAKLGGKLSIESPWKYGGGKHTGLDSIPIPEGCPLKNEMK